MQNFYERFKILFVVVIYERPKTGHHQQTQKVYWKLGAGFVYEVGGVERELSGRGGELYYV